jgi:hypothetical protein
MKRLFILFLVVIMLAGCGRRSIVKQNIEDSGTEVNKSECSTCDDPLDSPIFPLIRVFVGSSAAFIGYKISNYTAVFVGLLLAGEGMVSFGITMHDWITNAPQNELQRLVEAKNRKMSHVAKKHIRKH